MTKSKGLRKIHRDRRSPLITDSEGDPYAEGWDAHENGKTVGDNPYKPQGQSKKHDLWERGWYSRDVL
jgi:hypothetical protein